mgnify:CR=1 FL=1|tara:strand:+ start:13146 stop:13361 length:216 start_codon:yes stop_codon:yes gene_type:complete
MKKPKQPKLRIVHNNLEFERQPVARILDAQPTILHEFEKFVEKVQELALKTEALENKLKIVSEEIDDAEKI